MGMCGSRPLRAGGQPERSLCDGEIDIRRYDVDVVGFHRHAVGGFPDRHGGGARENLGQQAVVLGVEMLHEDDGQTGVGRQIGQQMFEDFEAARGSANSDHGNGCRTSGRRFGHFFGFVRRWLIDHVIRILEYHWDHRPTELRPDSAQYIPYHV